MSSIPNRSLKTMALVSVTAAATSLLIQACGGAQAGSAPAPDQIQGTWSSEVTIKDCASGAILKQFGGTSLFHYGGTLSADNTMPVPSRGAAFGVWQAGSGGEYTADIWFYRFNADGTVAGTQKVERTLTLSADGNTLSGPLTLQVLDSSGAIVQQGCGTEVSKRVTF
jgi:hypothetical protein